MKKITILFVLSLLVFILASCTTTSGFSLRQKSAHTDNFISVEHKSSDQTFTKEFKIKDGKATTIKFDIVTIGGNIKIDIVDDNGDSIYSGNQIPTSSFEVDANKSGKYKLTVITNSHQGSFKIIWNFDK